MMGESSRRVRRLQKGQINSRYHKNSRGKENAQKIDRDNRTRRKDAYNIAGWDPIIDQLRAWN